MDTEEIICSIACWLLGISVAILIFYGFGWWAVMAVVWPYSALGAFYTALNIYAAITAVVSFFVVVGIEGV